MAEPALTDLRREIAAIDRRLIAGLRARQRAAARIGRVKSVRGIALRDPAVERAVLNRWRRGLQASGVSVARISSLVDWILEESVREQERVGASRRGRPPQLRITLVGSRGAMARRLAPLFRANGHQVLGIARPRTRSGRRRGIPPARLAAACADADVIFIATSLAAAPAMIDAVAATHCRGVIADLMSVKAPVRSSLERARTAGCSVASAHPLFGPSTTPLYGRTVIVVDCGDRTATRRLREVFEGLGFQTPVATLTEHDRWMATMQALPRIVALLFAGEVGRSRPPGTWTPPPSFERQATVARRALAEETSLLAAILQANPATRRTVARLAAHLVELGRGVRGRTGRTLEQAHRRAARALGGT